MLEALIAAFAPMIAASTMQGIVAIESAGRPWVVHDNTTGASREFASREAAAAFARERIAAGASVDLGLVQINCANLGWLGLTVEEVLEPCTNLAAGQAILQESYERATRRTADAQGALTASVSAYNTGSFAGGITNGYVAKIRNAARLSAIHVPAFEADEPPAAAAESAGQETTGTPPPAWDPYGRAGQERRSWDVFARHVPQRP
jgi:type IV secretion system protein VirB1